MRGRGPWQALALFLTSGLGVWVSPGALATEIEPPSRPCVLVNGYKEIFVGRVTSVQESGPAQVQVLRAYKGTVSGTVIVTPNDILSGSGSLHLGETYIFYSSGPSRDPSVGREVTLWSTKPLSQVEPAELKLLREIDQPPYTGTIFGTLDRRLTVLESKPLPNVKVLATKGRKVYSSITDKKGRFEITDLPAGDYRIGADLGEAFAVELESNDEPIHVEPRGCFEAHAVAVNNATIRGRITLPAGLEVEGTHVSARGTREAGIDLEGVADRYGRYEIVGLYPGEYVIGINLGFDFPRAETPFPATYYPSTQDPDEAKRFVIEGPAHFSDVDISVPAAGEIVNLRIQATFEDGRPAPDQLVGLSDSGYGTRDGERTDAHGMASIPIVRGTRYIVMDFGMQPNGCPAPVTVGPENYPDIVHLVYSEDGCREEFNVVKEGMLRASVRGDFSQIPITVSWSDGSPVYDANVRITSSRDSVPFIAVFITGRNGRADMPFPLGQEFRVEAQIICTNAHRDSQSLLFNTESGIHWRELDSRSSGTPVWNTLTPSAFPIHLVLRGSVCASRSEPK